LYTLPEVVIYLPKSFPKGFKDKVKEYGAKIVEVQGPLKICQEVYSTGELGTGIKEQSLVIYTEKGLVVITGCAHPGIVKIVNKAKDLVKSDVLLVMGGFHLGGESKGEIENIISSFRKLG
jgi:7,8-dihydropterin-6-yl-methyl-4-(beta-D-ribofuranosyl)aminobenzene 5'-phosphate synthase